MSVPTPSTDGAPDPTLADRLEEDADYIERQIKWQRYQNTADEYQRRANRVRAAAVRLREADEDRRKLDAIETAFGDVERIRWSARAAEGHPYAADVLTALADALGDTE